jgi:hypothetical protein
VVEISCSCICCSLRNRGSSSVGKWLEYKESSIFSEQTVECYSCANGIFFLENNSAFYSLKVFRMPSQEDDVSSRQNRLTSFKNKGKNVDVSMNV